MSDPAGWYSDPTTRHELRYWDGYTWLDDVSDAGAAASDPLGGKPMPPPSEAAAQAQLGPSPKAKSNTPLYVGIGVGVVVIVIAAFLVLGKSDSKKGESVTALADAQVTFNDDTDVAHPSVHKVHIKANTVVILAVKSDNRADEPGIVVLTAQQTVDAVGNQIDGAKDLLSSSLKDACSNLREEDIGATGNFVYLARASKTAGTQLDTFMVVPVEGDYEFVPVLVNSKGQCEAGKSTLDINPKFVDFSNVHNLDDLAKVLQDDPDLASLAN